MSHTDILRKRVRMMATASRVMQIARSQIGVCEKPANSNRQPYGRDYGWNGTFWCAQFVWWCAWMADKKQTKTIAKSASAAYIHEETVKMGGSWAMKQTSKLAPRKNYLKKAKPGDMVSFDFGAMDGIRDHIGLVDRVEGNYIICIEGNTSKKGSQSNGGMVCEQRRLYTEICCATRPKYSGSSPIPDAKYSGKLPTLPKRGWLQKGDKGEQVKLMQKFLIWAGFSVGEAGADGDFGNATKLAVKAFQSLYCTSIDGGWGKECNAVAKSMSK